MLPTLTCRDVDVRRGAIIRPGPENPARRGQGRCARKKGPPRRTLLGPGISAVGAGVEQTKIDDRLTRPRCPWTNGQVERMNRTIKDATVKRYHYASHDELRQHLQLFMDAYNYGRRLKTLRGLTPYEFICQT